MLTEEVVGRVSNDLESPISPETTQVKEEVVGRVSNESASAAINQGTSGAKEELVGRVVNELEKNVDPGSTSHEEEIGVVNNEIKSE